MAVQRNAAQLAELVEETSALSTTLKRRIQGLERQPGSGRDGQIRKQQVGGSGKGGKMVLMGFFLPADRVYQVQVRGCDPKLSTGGTTVPTKVQATNGEAVQDRWVLFVKGRSVMAESDVFSQTGRNAGGDTGSGE